MNTQRITLQASRMVGFALFLGGCLALLSLPAAGAPAQRPDADPLAALPQNEVSVTFEDTKIQYVFRALAGLAGVPFILDFEPNDTRVSLKATNVSFRAVLGSIAASVRLVYELTDAGIVVRRVDGAPVAQPVTLGKWGVSPYAPGPLYRIELEAREPAGILALPAILLPVDVLRTVRQPLVGSRRVTALNPEKRIAEPRVVGALQVNLCVKAESASGLELVHEVLVDRPLGDSRYSTEHTASSAIVGHGEQVLFESADGYRVTLKSWSRVK